MLHHLLRQLASRLLASSVVQEEVDAAVNPAAFASSAASLKLSKERMALSARVLFEGAKQTVDVHFEIVVMRVQIVFAGICLELVEVMRLLP